MLWQLPQSAGNLLQLVYKLIGLELTRGLHHQVVVMTDQDLEFRHGRTVDFVLEVEKDLFLKVPVTA